MTLPSIAAARAGMVKCPVVVPSPLSCRRQRALVPGGLLLAADELVLVGVDDFWSGSTASIARRAMRRSWSGLNRAAFSTRDASTVWRCSALTVSGS